MGIWTIRTHDNSYPKHLVPRTTRIQNISYPRQTLLIFHWDWMLFFLTPGTCFNIRATSPVKMIPIIKIWWSWDYVSFIIRRILMLVRWHLFLYWDDPRYVFVNCNTLHSALVIASGFAWKAQTYTCVWWYSSSCDKSDKTCSSPAAIYNNIQLFTLNIKCFWRTRFYIYIYISLYRFASVEKLIHLIQFYFLQYSLCKSKNNSIQYWLIAPNLDYTVKRITLVLLFSL